ncbi:MAG: tetratricopeptide repeat protein [Archangium sp.]|nr:tetratricopeptide repeat protein [Archangium sp.]
MAFTWVMSSASVAAPNADFERAVQLNEKLQYAEALKALELALNQPGNDRAGVLKIYELQCILLSTLGQAAESVRCFQKVLSLEPEAKLAGSHPPRVRTAFLEARGAMRGHGLAFVRVPSDVVSGQMTLLSIRIDGDPLKLIRAVRFHRRIGPRDWKSTSILVVNGVASMEAPPPPVEWWAEALGERDVVLLTLGDQATPVVEQVTVQPSVPPPPAPVVQHVPNIAPAPISGLKVAAVVSWVVAVGLGVTSGVAHARYVSALTAFNEGVAKVDENQNVVGITQLEAYEHQRTASFNRSLATGFLGAAAGTAVLGAVLFVVGAVSSTPSSAPNVALNLSPGAAAVSFSWALP